MPNKKLQRLITLKKQPRRERNSRKQGRDRLFKRLTTILVIRRELKRKDILLRTMRQLPKPWKKERNRKELLQRIRGMDGIRRLSKQPKIWKRRYKVSR